MKEVRLGIIGIGNMGSGHFKNVYTNQVPNLRLVAVADLLENRRQWSKENSNGDITIFEDGKELMDSGICDAVLIATPHYQHPELVIYALEKNLHVMSEKPAGVYTKQVRQMNEVAEKSDKVFGMMFNQRGNQVYRKMYEMVQNGDIGELRRVNWIITDWYRTQNYYDSGSWRATWEGEGGGVLLNQCPHNLDLIQWICGMPSKVRAFCHQGKWHDIEVEDDVTAYMEFENGATGVFITTTGDAPGTNRFEVTGNLGKLVCEDGKLSFYKLEENLDQHLVTCKGGFDQPKYELINIELEGEDEQHIGVLKAFTGKILNNTNLTAEGVEGINGLMLSNAMHLSSWLEKEVTIPIDEDLFYKELDKRRKNSRQKVGTGIVFDTDNSY